MAQLSNGRGDCPGTIGACNDAVEPGTKRKCADFAARISQEKPCEGARPSSLRPCALRVRPSEREIRSARGISGRTGTPGSRLGSSSGFRSVVVTSRITARGLDSIALAYYVRAVPRTLTDRALVPVSSR